MIDIHVFVDVRDADGNVTQTGSATRHLVHLGAGKGPPEHIRRQQVGIEAQHAAIDAMDRVVGASEPNPPITVNCADCGQPQRIQTVRCARCARERRAEILDVTGDVRRRVADIIEGYMDGPCGEPNIADAHDFLLAIQQEIGK